MEHEVTSGDMETGTLLNDFVSFFSSSLLWISAQYKWRQHRFEPPSERVKWTSILPVQRFRRKVYLSGTDQ